MGIIIRVEYFGFLEIIIMPARGRQLTCPNCGLQVRFTKNTAVISKKKSAARVARGKRLAKALPRDERGKFLPRGSENRFVGRAGRTPAPKRKKKTSTVSARLEKASRTRF